MNPTLEVRQSKSGKTKYFGVLLDGGVWIATLTKSAAQQLIEYYKQHGQRQDISTNSTVPVKQRDESINLPSDTVDGERQSRTSNGTDDIETGRDSVLPQPTETRQDDGDAGSDATEDQISSSQLPGFIQASFRDSEEREIRRNERFERIFRVATTAVTMVRANVELTNSRGERGIHQIEPTTIDVSST